MSTGIGSSPPIAVATVIVVVVVVAVAIAIAVATWPLLILDILVTLPIGSTQYAQHRSSLE